jgi:hypothetical protein
LNGAPFAPAGQSPSESGAGFSSLCHIRSTERKALSSLMNFSLRTKTV